MPVVGGAWPELEGDRKGSGRLGLGKMDLDWFVHPLSISLTPERGSRAAALGPGASTAEAVD